MQALAIAKWQFWVYLAADIIAGLAIIAAVVGATIAFKSLRASQWNTLLLFEQDMETRRARFQAIGAELDDCNGTHSTMLALRFDEAKESYFNSLDRLASSIIKDHFPDPEMKLDYREVFVEVVRGFPKDFDTGTRYRKVIKLYNNWQDQV